MRISTPQIFQQGLNAILEQQARAARTQLQLATGQRILGPGDDPVGAARAQNLGDRVQLTAQYQDNIRFAETRLAVEEGALAAALNVVQRVRELAIRANNAALSGGDREAVAVEVRQRLDELLGIANTRDGSGEYLFAGFQGATQPFVRSGADVLYNGDQGQRLVQVGAGHRVAVGDSGHDVFLAVREGNGDFAVRADPGNGGGGVIDAGVLLDGSAYDRDTYSIEMAARTTVVGGTIDLVDTGTADTLGYALRINGVLVDSLVAGDGRTPAQIAAAINAETGSTGVQALIEGGELLLTRSVADGGPVTVTETLTGASDEADRATGFFGSALSGVTGASRDLDLGSAANSFLVRDGSAAVIASGNYQSAGAIGFAGLQTSISGTPAAGDRFSVSPSANRSVFAVIDTLVQDLSSGGAALGNAMNRALTDLDQHLDRLLEVRADVGARLNTLESQGQLNEDVDLRLRESLSAIQDLDYAAAAIQLNQELLGLQAAQQAFIRVQALNLFDFLR